MERISISFYFLWACACFLSFFDVPSNTYVLWWCWGGFQLEVGWGCWRWVGGLQGRCSRADDTSKSHRVQMTWHQSGRKDEREGAAAVFTISDCKTVLSFSPVTFAKSRSRLHGSSLAFTRLVSHSPVPRLLASLCLSFFQAPFLK